MSSSSDENAENFFHKDDLIAIKKEKLDSIESDDRIKSPKKNKKTKNKTQSSKNRHSEGKSNQNKSSDSEDAFKCFKHKSTAQNYFQKKSNLKLSSDDSILKTVLTQNDINSDDEIFLVQTVKHVEVENFVGKKIKLSKPTKITDDDDNEYQCTFSLNTKNQQIALISPESVSSSAITLPLHGFLNINQNVEENLEILPDALSTTDPDCVPYPTNLKTRHPLHGLHYEQLIELPDNVRSKLKQATDDCSRKVSSPKKRKLIKLEEGDEQKYQKKKQRKQSIKEEHDDAINVKEELPELSDLGWLSEI